MVSKRMIAIIGGIVVLVLAGSLVGAGALAEEEEGEIGERGTSAIGCGDNTWCNRPDWAIKVVNPGEGHGIWAKSGTYTKWKAALYGEATNVGCGLSGKSNLGDGVRGYSTNGYGGRFNSANTWSGVFDNGVLVTDSWRSGIQISNAGWHGVEIDKSSWAGVVVEDSGYDGFEVIDAGRYGLHIHKSKRRGVYIEEALEGGVVVDKSGGNGVLVSDALVGGQFTGWNCGIKAYSWTGNLIEAWDNDPTKDRRFMVTNIGNVHADGSYDTPASDFAEMLAAVEGLEPADVLVVNQDGKLDRSGEPYATSVVGVYSTKPGFVGGWDDDEDMTGKVPLAVVGVVPVKASAENGTIRPGDLLATSSIPGHAMKAVEPKLGTLIGKALGTLESGTGTIQMLVTLQ